MLQIIIIILIVAADQITKFLLVPMLLGMPDQATAVIEGVFHLKYIENTGASFGMMPGMRVFFIIMTIVTLIVLAVYMIKTRKKKGTFLKLSLALITGGAIGNLIDRIMYGYVRDMFELRIVRFPYIFNIADASLVIGSIMLGIFILFIYKEKDGGHLINLRGKKKRTEEELEETPQEASGEAVPGDTGQKDAMPGEGMRADMGQDSASDEGQDTK